MISLFPIRNQLNNGVLSGVHAMPQKNITSNNDSNFSNSRHTYIESYSEQTQPLVKAVNHMDQASTVQKKWIGGNRDASDIISKRRINSIGTGSLKASGNPMSFQTHNDRNTERQAYHRVRSGGSAVPAKCTNKYANPPVFH